MGVAKEMARFVLPAWTIYYTAICTVDAHNLMNFIRLRDSEHAQCEIQQYAKRLRWILQEVMPVTYEAFREAENVED